MELVEELKEADKKFRWKQRQILLIIMKIISGYVDSLVSPLAKLSNSLYP